MSSRFIDFVEFFLTLVYSVLLGLKLWSIFLRRDETFVQLSKCKTKIPGVSKESPHLFTEVYRGNVNQLPGF